MQKKEYIRYEDLPLQTADGRQINVEFVSNVYLVNRQKVIQCNIRDITDQKLAMKELLASEERYRSILNASPDGIAITDLQGRILMTSPAAFTLFGFDRDREKELLGRLITDFIVPEDRERAASNFALMFQGVMQGPGEYIGLRVDGTTFDMEANGEFVRGSDGQPTGVVFIVRDITGRRRAVEAIRESEEKYRNLVDNANEAILVAQDGLLKFVNRKALEMFGYSEQELKSRPFPEFIHPDDRGMVVENYKNRINGKPVQAGRYTFRHLTDDGAVRWVEMGTVRIDWQGKPATLNFLTDVTKRKQAEEELQKLASVVRNSSELVNLATFDGKLIFCNEAGAAMLGISETDIGKANVIQFIPAHLREKAETELLPALRNKGRWSGELQYLNQKTGKLTDVHAMCFVIKNPSTGAPWYMANISTDITERKQAEERLRQSEEKFAKAFQTSPYAVTITRPEDGRFIEINDAFMSMSGFTREEALASSSVGLKFWVNEEDRNWVIATLREGRAVSGQEFRIRHKSGEILTCLFSAQIIRLNNEPCVLCSINDITERKQHEEERARLTDQLQQAMKMEAVGRLAGGVAHDFNNLLTGITGNISLALMDLKPDDPLAGILVDVNKAAHSAATLTRQLLAFSRRQIIEPEVLNLNDLVTNFHKMLVRLIGENIELKTIPAGNLGAVKADPGQIEQVLINLVVNARDSMPHGGKLVIETANVELDAEYCRTRAPVQPGRYVMLAVSDTGEGMSREVKERLFEPFFTTKPKGRGTGLGLATTYGAIKQSGGSIDVYSEVGKGSTFKVYLPMVERKVETGDRQKLITDLTMGTETILVVEDEDMVRQFAVKILERLGFKVLHASNGEQGLLLAEEYKDRIDLLMTDVVMPGMNGRQLADKVKKVHPETAVLFTSGYTEDIIVSQGVVEESLNFIGKPYTPQSISNKIRQVLDKR